MSDSVFWVLMGCLLVTALALIGSFFWGVAVEWYKALEKDDGW